MEAELERSFPLTGPLDLASTVRLQAMWGETTWMRVDPTGAWHAWRTPDGPGTVCVQHAGDHLHAAAWGPGAAHALEGVPAWLGLDDIGVDAIVPQHPVMRELVHHMRGYRVGRTGQLYERLVSVALAQKVTGKESKAALRDLAWRWGERAPGPRDDLRLLPEPAVLARRPYFDFHPLGIERHRAELVVRIASRASALQRAAAMPHAEARAHLEKLPGIGPWTSGVIVGGVLGDPDAVPMADFHLPNFVVFNLAGEARGEDGRMIELLAPYAGQRGRVVRMIKAGGREPPKFGPKAPVRDLRGM